MRVLRVVRRSAFAGAALVVAAIAVFKFAPGVRECVSPRSGRTVFASTEDTVSVPAGLAIGGRFKLTDEKGSLVIDADYRGRSMLVFFGYTNCPDECPLTLQKMAKRLTALFITVDPARDTPKGWRAILGISIHASD